MMSNRYNVLHCDLEDTESIKSVGEVVKARALKGACSYFELETLLSVRLVIESNPAFGAKVQILDEEGIVGEVMSSSGAVWHRYLKVERSVLGLSKGLIAHKILALINAVETKIPEENVRGSDMILFYIREGYMPVSRTENWEGLKSDLVEYMKYRKPLREPERRLIPMTKLELKPNEAAEYWEELKEKAGYSETGNRN